MILFLSLYILCLAHGCPIIFSPAALPLETECCFYWINDESSERYVFGTTRHLVYIMARVLLPAWHTQNRYDDDDHWKSSDLRVQ